MMSRGAVGVAVTAFAVAVAMVAISAVAASARPVAARNLLKNGGAEAGPGSRDEAKVVAKIPGWKAAVDERDGQFNVLVYESISPKDAQRGNYWPSTAASRLIKGGRKLFVGGYMAPGRTSSTLTQSVNVAGQRKAIDAGKLSRDAHRRARRHRQQQRHDDRGRGLPERLRQETGPDQDRAGRQGAVREGVLEPGARDGPARANRHEEPAEGHPDDPRHAASATRWTARTATRSRTTSASRSERCAKSSNAPGTRRPTCLSCRICRVALDEAAII